MPRKRATAASKRLSLPFAPKDSRADAKRRKAAARRERTDPAYLAWAHQFGCLVGRECSGPLAFHHEPAKSAEGGSAWSDRSGCILCWRHHDRFVTGSRHAEGLEGFERMWGVSIKTESDRLNDLYEKEGNHARTRGGGTAAP